MRARLIIMVSGLICLTAFTAALFLSYQSGCAGDTKGGAYGDPGRALQLEGQAMTWLAFGLMAGIPAVGFQVSRTAKIVGGVGLVLSAPALWIACIWTEVSAVWACSH